MLLFGRTKFAVDFVADYSCLFFPEEKTYVETDF